MCRRLWAWGSASEENRIKTSTPSWFSLLRRKQWQVLEGNPVCGWLEVVDAKACKAGLGIGVTAREVA